MAANSANGLLVEVASYYTQKLAQYGQVPNGVDWNSAEGQLLRFQQLCEVIKGDIPFSINDLGCGYGALLETLDERYDRFSYLGIDISENMILAARSRFNEKSEARFIVSNVPDQTADYGVACSIFNVRLGRSDSEWQSYLESTLDILNRTSRIGFAFNCLTSYSDRDKMRDYLYYADPCALFNLCKFRYSRNVALFHDYDLYEFTIVVRKQL